jgi:magnesium-transporting ATPase (P-type)
MDKLKQKFLKKREKNHQLHKKATIGGSIIATVIAITPYLFYLHESIPETKTWDTFLFTYTSHHFEDVNYVFWIFTSKAIPLMLLLIWFFTNRHWWYHTLIVPIAMYTYQIVALFNDDYTYIDELQLIYLVPIMAIVVPSIYLLRAKMFNKINEANKSMEELEEEFMMKPKSFWGKVKQYF